MRQLLLNALMVEFLPSLPATSTADPELRGTPAELQRFLKMGSHSVTLEGHAKQIVQADLGHVVVVVHTLAKDLTGAIITNGQRRDALTKALQDQGIDSKAIRTEKFSTSPQYSCFGKAPSSYEVVNQLNVEVADERQVTIVTGAASGSADLSIGAMTFEYSKQRELEEQVRRAAFDDALAKKSFYEQRLGVKLVPTEFSFSDMSARSTAGAVALEEIVVTGTRRSSSDSAATNLPPPPPSFDEKEYEVKASVTFLACTMHEGTDFHGHARKFVDFGA